LGAQLLSVLFPVRSLRRKYVVVIVVVPLTLLVCPIGIDYSDALTASVLQSIYTTTVFAERDFSRLHIEQRFTLGIGEALL
jgi:hypothetical protein